MDKDKAPSPDGFTTGFFQDCWDVIKADLMKVFEEFHRNGKIGVNINSTFITLVPKRIDRLELKITVQLALLPTCIKSLQRSFLSA